MMVAQRLIEPAMACAIEHADPAVLDRAAQPEVHLALWSRPLPPDLGWLAGLDWDGIADLDFQAPLTDLDAEIAAALHEAGYPVDAQGAALQSQIAMLARHFARIFDLGAVKIRLEVIDTDACRKFHADYVIARMLTTLVGPGTQWIHAMNQPDAPLRQMRMGDVGIFKGRLATDHPAILHRSPPIADGDEARLLLVIDPG